MIHYIFDINLKMEIVTTNLIREGYFIIVWYGKGKPE